MQDILLMIVVLAAFLFGWFIMKKVDIFLEECRRAQTGRSQTDISICMLHGGCGKVKSHTDICSGHYKTW